MVGYWKFTINRPRAVGQLDELEGLVYFRCPSHRRDAIGKPDDRVAPNLGNKRGVFRALQNLQSSFCAFVLGHGIEEVISNHASIRSSPRFDLDIGDSFGIIESGKTYVQGALGHARLFF